MEKQQRNIEPDETLNAVSKPIPRPDISIAQIILLILSQSGKATFRQLRAHPNVRMLASTRSENSFYTALARLKRRRAITRSPDHHYELTPVGEYASLKAYVRKELRDAEMNTDAKIAWDGKWRLVLFDIPESKRPVRDYLRAVLKRQGFVEFQRSLWVWPYRLPQFLKKMMADPQLRKYARVVTTYDIDYDEDLRRKFKLH